MAENYELEPKQNAPWIYKKKVDAALRIMQMSSNLVYDSYKAFFDMAYEEKGEFKYNDSLKNLHGLINYITSGITKGALDIHEAVQGMDMYSEEEWMQLKALIPIAKNAVVDPVPSPNEFRYLVIKDGQITRAHELEKELTEGADSIIDLEYNSSSKDGIYYQGFDVKQPKYEQGRML